VAVREDTPPSSEAWCVVVEHNLVSAITRVDALQSGVVVPASRLEVGTQLARNNLERGSIDGRYYFDSAQRARVFAELCLEFTRALAERRRAEVARLAAGAEWSATGS
jgi:hypothetical protein